MQSKPKQKSASSSAINGGAKINRFEVEVINNTESSNHWDFLVILNYHYRLGLRCYFLGFYYWSRLCISFV